MDWDHCMGQSYTDSTSELYSEEPCGEINTTKLWNSWDKVKSEKKGFRVPLLCAGGNCQGDLPCCLPKNKNSTKDCNIDERLNKTGLSKVFSSLPKDKYPNMGLWFGFGVKPDLCERCNE